MHWRTRIGAAGAAATLLAMTGCTMSLGFLPSDDEETREARRDDEAPAVVHHERAEPAPSRRNRHDADAVIFEGSHAGADQASRDAAVRVVSGPRLGLRGILGQVDGQPAFTAEAGGDSDNLTQITFTREGGDFDPAVDATGEWLLYASTRHRETADLFLKRVDGTTVTQLTNEAANDVTPAFSPDGKRVAFASDRAGTFDIYIMDVRGGQPMQITRDETHDLHPSFSPDGTRLVYTRFGGPSGQWEMVVVELDNPGTRRLIGPGLFPQWSPGADRIAFQRPRQRGTRWFSAWTIELDDDGEVSSPTQIASSTNAAVITPRWSPDGEHLVFCTVIDPPADNEVRPARSDVWVVSADGRGRARLTGGRYANLQPTWAADGTIYFVSDRAGDGAENIWPERPDRVLQLVSPADGGSDPSVRVPTQ